MSNENKSRLIRSMTASGYATTRQEEVPTNLQSITGLDPELKDAVLGTQKEEVILDAIQRKIEDGYPLNRIIGAIDIYCLGKGDKFSEGRFDANLGSHPRKEGKVTFF